MSRSRKQPGPGRHKGSRNKGYWFRAGRGWYTTDNGQKIPLRDEKGNHYKDLDTPEELIQQSYARHVLGQRQQTAPDGTPDAVPLVNVITAYLAQCQRDNRCSTFSKRGEFLFDLCFGLPCRFWDYGTGRKVPQPSKADYLHDGYGKQLVGTLTPLDVQKWLDQHKGWGKGTRRMATQALKRALNWAAREARIIKANPIRGFKVSTGRKRLIVFTATQERAMYAAARPALATAIRVSIRTGARYGSEFVRLTAAHVEETDRGMIWRFSPDEAKTGKLRTIYVAPEIAEIVRPLVRRYPQGPLFRNSRGKPWTIRALRCAFLRLRQRLDKSANAAERLPAGASLYGCRHTFAKRTLGGFWTGQPSTIEVLAGLMGNSRQIAWEHYGKWCESYTDPLWAATLGNNGMATSTSTPTTSE